MTESIRATDNADAPVRPSQLAGLKAFSKAPLFFFGLGIYRAWIELIYVRPLVATPAESIAGHDIFDVSMMVALLLCALAARKLVPLFEKRFAVVLCILMMVGATLLTIVSYYVPASALYIAYPAAVIAGFGTALMILLWSELYGCLNPLRVAFYYSGSLIIAALIIFLFMGFNDTYVFGGIVLLPIFSILCLFRSYRYVPTENMPKRVWGRFSFPWKPVLLMAVYAFAYGMREHQLYLMMGPHSSIGVVIAAAIVFVGVLAMSTRFNFSITYRVALPLMVCGFLLAPSFTPASSELSNIFISMSYTSFSILIMLILSNMSYRLGIGAVWLFGVERGLRAMFMYAGRETTTLLENGVLSDVVQSTTATAIIIVLVVAATMILLSEKELSSRWGITFLGPGDAGAESSEQHRLVEVCSEFSKKYKLSPREGEVLLLLARRKDLGSIEKELFIANGTAKAHIRHIYGKMGIHKRQELYEMLGIENESKAT